MPWKLIGGILVLISAAAIGGIFAGRVKEQEEWLKEIKLVLLLLSGELNYHKTPLPEAFLNVAGRHDGALTEFFQNLSEELSEKNGAGFKEVWAEQAERIMQKTPLSTAQKREFVSISECFSETDSAARENTVAFYINRLETELSEFQKTGRDKAYLYRMLGMLGGIFLLILMI